MDVTPVNPFQRGRYDVRQLAKYQRIASWLVFLSVFNNFSMCLGFPASRSSLNSGLPSVLAVTLLASHLTVVFGGVLLMWWLRTNGLMLVIGFGSLLIPWIGFFVLLMEVRRAAIVLRKTGLPAGFFGPSDEEVVRAFAPNLCRECGYNLTGNISGICPECGAVVGDRLPSQLRPDQVSEN